MRGDPKTSDGRLGPTGAQSLSASKPAACRRPRPSSSPTGSPRPAPWWRTHGLPRRTRPGRREPRVRRADLRGRPAARQLALEPRPFRAVGSRGRGRRTVAAAPSAPAEARSSNGLRPRVLPWDTVRSPVSRCVTAAPVANPGLSQNHRAAPLHALRVTTRRGLRRSAGNPARTRAVRSLGIPRCIRGVRLVRTVMDIKRHRLLTSTAAVAGARPSMQRAILPSKKQTRLCSGQAAPNYERVQRTRGQPSR